MTDYVRGHQIGRERDAREFAGEGLGQRFDEQRFAESGNAFEQDMGTGKQPDQYFIENGRLADDYFGQFVTDGL